MPGWTLTVVGQLRLALPVRRRGGVPGWGRAGGRGTSESRAAPTPRDLRPEGLMQPLCPPEWKGGGAPGPRGPWRAFQAEATAPRARLAAGWGPGRRAGPAHARPGTWRGLHPAVPGAPAAMRTMHRPPRPRSRVQTEGQPCEGSAVRGRPGLNQAPSSHLSLDPKTRPSGSPHRTCSPGGRGGQRWNRGELGALHSAPPAPPAGPRGRRWGRPPGWGRGGASRGADPRSDTGRERPEDKTPSCQQQGFLGNGTWARRTGLCFLCLVLWFLRN